MFMLWGFQAHRSLYFFFFLIFLLTSETKFSGAPVCLPLLPLLKLCMYKKIYCLHLPSAHLTCQAQRGKQTWRLSPNTLLTESQQRRKAHLENNCIKSPNVSPQTCFHVALPRLTLKRISLKKSLKDCTINKVNQKSFWHLTCRQYSKMSIYDLFH